MLVGFHVLKNIHEAGEEILYDGYESSSSYGQNVGAAKKYVHKIK